MRALRRSVAILTFPPPVLTACLSCSWVHGYPWRCPLPQRRQNTNDGVLVPRGVFFDSKLFGALNGSWDPNSPLAGATINGTDNNGSRSLNARVIQMVITRNATLAQSWKILA